MIVGTVLIPQGAGLLLFLLPLFGFGKMRTFGHILGVVVVTGLIAGVGVLTCLALADDTLDPVARRIVDSVGHDGSAGDGGRAAVAPGDPGTAAARRLPYLRAWPGRAGVGGVNGWHRLSDLRGPGRQPAGTGAAIRQGRIEDEDRLPDGGAGQGPQEKARRD